MRNKSAKLAAKIVIAMIEKGLITPDGSNQRNIDAVCLAILQIQKDLGIV